MAVVLACVAVLGLQPLGSSRPVESVEKVAVDDSRNIVYAATGATGLVIYDVSGSGAPVYLGSYDTRGHAEGVAVGVWPIVYVADGNEGLLVIDVQDPANPRRIVQFKPTGVPVSFVAVVFSGSRVFVADSTASSGLYILNVDGTTVSTLGRYVTSGLAVGVYVDNSNNRAYVADYGEGMHIVDISQPSAPSLRSTHATIGNAVGVSVVGGIAYIADSGATSGLTVVDVSNPVAPVRLGSYITTGPARGVDVVGTVAYVAADWSGLALVDVSDPTDPQFIIGYSGSSSAYGVVVRSGTAFIADHTYGFKVVDVSGASSASPPVLLGEHDTPSLAFGVFAQGNRAYVCDSDPNGSTGGRLLIYDVTVPSVPVMLGEYATTAFAVQVVGDLAYIAASHSNGLVIVNIATPASPTLVGSYNTPGTARAVKVVGPIVYVADGSSGLVVINAIDPAAPVLLGSYNTPTNAHDLEVEGSWAYIADGNGGGLLILDVSVPETPLFVSSFAHSGFAMSVHVVGTLAYLASDAVVIIDVTAPASPTEVGSIRFSNSYPHSIFVESGLAVVASLNNGVRLIDVSDPASPSEVAQYHTPGIAYGVYAIGKTVYVADVGLYILDSTVVATPVPAAPSVAPVRYITREMITRTGSPATDVELDDLKSSNAILALIYYYDTVGSQHRYLVMCHDGPCNSALFTGWQYEAADLNSIEHPELFNIAAPPGGAAIDMYLKGGCGDGGPGVEFSIPIGQCGPLVPRPPHQNNLALLMMKGGVHCSENGTRAVAVTQGSINLEECTAQLRHFNEYPDEASPPSLLVSSGYKCMKSQFSGGGVDVVVSRCGVAPHGYVLPLDDERAKTLKSNIATAGVSTVTALSISWQSRLGDITLRKAKGTMGSGVVVRGFGAASVFLITASAVGTLLLIIGYGVYYSEAEGNDTIQFELLNRAYWWYIGVQICACLTCALHRARLLPHPTGLTFMVVTTVAAVPLVELVTHHALTVALALDRGEGCWRYGCTAPASSELEHGIRVAVAGGVLAAAADIALVFLGCLAIESGKDPLSDSSEDECEGDAKGVPAGDEEETKKTHGTEPVDNEDVSQPSDAPEEPFWSTTRQYVLLKYGGVVVMVLGLVALGLWAAVWEETNGWCREATEQSRSLMHWWYALLLVVTGFLMYDAAADVRGSWSADRFMPMAMLAVSVAQVLQLIRTGKRFSELFYGDMDEERAEALVGVGAVIVVVMVLFLVALALSPDDPRWNVKALAQEKYMMALNAEGKVYKPGVMSRFKIWCEENKETVRWVQGALSILSVVTAAYTFISFLCVVEETKDDMSSDSADAYEADASIIHWMNFFQVVVAGSVLLQCLTDTLTTFRGLAIALTLIAMVNTPIMIEHTAELAQRYEGDLPSCLGERYPLV